MHTKLNNQQMTKCFLKYENIRKEITVIFTTTPHNVRCAQFVEMTAVATVNVRIYNGNDKYRAHQYCAYIHSKVMRKLHKLIEHAKKYK